MPARTCRTRGNLFRLRPDAAAGEVIEALACLGGGGAAGGGVRVERIMTDGQATPPGHWYDQPADEWVAVLAGWGEVEFAEPEAVERLRGGDWLLIPAGARHRVRAAGEGTLWLAVHGRP